MVPTKKISLTLIEYAQPLIEELPDGHSKSELEAVLKFATCAWNACVLNQWHKRTDYVAALRYQFAADSELRTIIDALIARKACLYGHDPRAITNETVVVSDGQFVVRAEARIDVENLEISSSFN